MLSLLHCKDRVARCVAPAAAIAGDVACLQPFFSGGGNGVAGKAMTAGFEASGVGYTLAWYIGMTEKGGWVIFHICFTFGSLRKGDVTRGYHECMQMIWELVYLRNK
jgi:hypothetical protein